jgi:hypothetical protein
MHPRRIRLSRAKGFRLPEDGVSVARPTKWGNPFVVGRDGTAADCVELYRKLIGGLICLSCRAPVAAQQAAARALARDWRELAGKRLACWCRLDRPCHADILCEAVDILSAAEAAAASAIRPGETP